MAQLQDIVVVSPEITGSILSTEAEFLTFIFDCDLAATQLNVKFNTVDYVETSYIVIGASKQFTFSLPMPVVEGSYSLITQAVNSVDQSPALTLEIIVAKNLSGVRCLPPSGVTIYKRKNSCKLSWVTPDYTGFLGVRVAKADTEIGPFITIGNLITKVSSVTKEVVSSNTAVVDTGTTITTTVTDFVSNISRSELEIQRIPSDLDTFYVVLSTVVQDPDTKQIYESQYNGPIKCGYVDLKRVSPTDFLALQNQEDIATRIVSIINNTNPDLDLSPRSEIRDLVVDPVSAELSNASIRVWFDEISRSISALDQIDDANNDGISDPVDTSDIKQSIASAFSISLDSVQSYIDSQFDIIADRVGVPRLGAKTALGTLKVYTTRKPTQRDEVLVNGLVSTVKDEQTPAVNFILRGSAVIDPNNADSIFNPAKNRWEVSIPIEADTAGSIGNVGAGTIRRVISGIPSGWQITNDAPTDYGWDQETNSNLAARIMDRMIVGVDSGTKMGLKSISKTVPGVLDVKVVGANDPEMLRDWDPVRNKHVYGSVDIYVKGISKSEIDNKLPFEFSNYSTYGSLPTYVILTRDSLGDGITLPIKYRISNPLLYPNKPLAPIEIFIDKGGSSSFYLDVTNSSVDANGVFSIDPNGIPYQIKNDVKVPLSSTNYGLIRDNQSAIARAFLRFNSGIEYTPSIQPVYSVTSISGETGKIGVIDSRKYRVLKSSDPLLSGNSDTSTDRIVVDQYLISDYKTLKFLVSGDSLTVDTGIFLNNGDFLIVKDEADPTIKYTKDIHYKITPTGQYNTYKIVRLDTATTPMPLNQNFVVGYNRIGLRESITLTTETKSISLVPSYLSYSGIIHNIWLPESYGLTAILNDPTMSTTPRSNRYIKVTYDNGSGPVVMTEGLDFGLVHNVDGSCSIYRLSGPGSRLQEDSTIVISYYRSEMLDIRYLYPAYINVLKTEIENIRHAGSDIVIKDMMDTKVDISMSVEVDAYTNIENIDNKIRTAISIAMDNTVDRLTQAELVKQIKLISGVTNIELPFRKFTRSDGSYEVGVVIPIGTIWKHAADDDYAKNFNLPGNTWITETSVLPTLTIPSGGRQDAFVDLLYGGEQMTRVLTPGALSGKDNGYFYIMGVGDTASYTDSGRIIFIPPTKIPDPSLESYKVTYQVFNEIGAKDITLSSTEYLRPGTLVIDYTTR